MSIDTTNDAFLGGKVIACQPKKGFRSGIDAVLLAAAVPARSGDTVLELGCGVGVASLCLDARVTGLTLTGVEMQTSYAELAQQNATSNQALMTVVCADLRDLPADLRQVQFTRVMMNPPYYDRARGHAAHNAGRDIALAGDTPLADWLDVGIKRLAPNGTLTIIQHITRLPEVLNVVSARLGSVVLRPIAATQDTEPGLFVLQAKHSGRAPFILSKNWIMHGADAAKGDVESYTPTTKTILRDGASFPMRD